MFQSKTKIKEEVEMMMKEVGIDGDSATRFYNQMVNPDKITDLTSTPRVQTLRSLLSVAYGNERDSPNESESVTLNAEECSEFFTKDGLLRLDKIMPLLPPVDEHRESYRHLESFINALESAIKALEHYNTINKDAPYELVTPVHCCGIHPLPNHQYFFHTNFFAKPLNDSSAVPELFFAELEACGVFEEDEEPVRKCCILKSNIIGVSSPGSLKTYSPVFIFHPEDVQCPCNTDPPGYIEAAIHND